MKRLLLILKVLMPLLMVPSSLCAYDFELEGIYYNIVDGNVSVTSGPTKYQGSIVVPSKVTKNNKTYSVISIGDNAFEACANLTSVTIPNSVIYIGYYAFYNCFRLTSVAIPNSVTSIYDKAFSGCSSITSITIPNSVTSIGIMAFEYCSGMKSITISNSVTSIGERAFSGCSSLTSVTIPNNMTSIDSYVFQDCYGLTSVTIPNSVTSIGHDAFNNCSSLTSITIPNSITTIEYRAFEHCSGLTSVNFPKSLTSIGSSAFGYCNSFTTIVSEIENPFKIRDDTFTSDTYKNVELIVPKGTKSAYQSTEGWRKFKKISDGTSEVEESEFMVNGINYSIIENNATVISNETKYQGNIVIPNQVSFNGKSYYVTSIGENAFKDCGELNSVDIPNSITCIGDYSFYACSAMTSIIIPNSVTSIGIKAFQNCSSLTYLTIPNSVTSIGHGAFYGCSGIKSVAIPKSVTHIGKFVFGGCSNLSSIKVESGNLNYDSRDNCNAIIEISSNTLITGLYNTIIPNSVTAIGDYAFYECSNLVTTIIPKSVKSIGKGAFGYCKNLISVISEIEKPFVIGDDVFDNTPSTIQLTVPKGTKAAYQATEGWNRFTNIVEAGGIEDVFEVNGICYKIGENSTVAVTKGNSNYSDDVVIPSQVIYEGKTYSVTSIDSWAFEDSYSLTSVTFPNSVISIGNGAFYSCINLTSITIPGSVTSIGDKAFYDCAGLKSVTIPDRVISFGDYAFGMCTNLTTIVSEIAKPYIIDTSVFDFYSQDYRTLIVPKGTKAAYQATEGWNIFANIVEAGETEPDYANQIHINGIYYKVTESGEAEVVSADNGVTGITIPSTVSHNNTSYKVTAIAKDAFEVCEQLAAVIWEPEVQFNAKVNNPNFLLYVSDEKYASRNVKNVVVNGVAESIELTDAANGNDFYCPRAFRAKSIVYSHNYQMETGIGDSRGWETIVLPFDVQKYTHATKGEIESFTTWSKSSSKKPFWLFELTASGYKDVAGIKANTPFIISMPNNLQYEQQYQIPGIVTFSASNVEVQKSDNLKQASYQGRSFVPNYTNKDGGDCLALNVNNYYVTNPGKDISGSKFVRGLRAVHPFEAYMTTSDNTRSIDVMEGMTTAIRGIQMVKDGASVIKVYDTRGVLMKTATSMDDVRNGLKAGVYIVNGKKMVIK